METLIGRDKSVIVAADVASDVELEHLVRQTHDVDGISAYKVGLRLALRHGLPRVVDAIRASDTGVPIIYDHQKAGNDIPDMGKEFADVGKDSQVDAVILFPFASRVTEIDWIKAAQDKGLHVIVGGHMTQPEFLESARGFIADKAPDRIYTIVAEQGVRDFVVPGNKIEYVSHYRQLLEEILGVNNFALYAPGFINQGGEISSFAEQAGPKWHAIVGTAIYKATDIRAAAELVTSQIR